MICYPPDALVQGRRRKGFSANQLKLIAIVAMTIDRFGMAVLSRICQGIDSDLQGMCQSRSKSLRYFGLSVSANQPPRQTHPNIHRYKIAIVATILIPSPVIPFGKPPAVRSDRREQVSTCLPKGMTKLGCMTILARHFPINFGLSLP